MKLTVCSVRDNVALQFGRPFYTINLGTAIRSFRVELANPESQISQYPADYDLYVLGEFDDETGKFDLDDIPNIAARGVDFLAAAAAGRAADSGVVEPSVSEN